MAVNAAHMLLYSTDAEATRAALRDVFGWQHVDAGGGWLIFGMPPAEVGVHPGAPGETDHQISLRCYDLGDTVEELRAKGIRVLGEPRTEEYGIVTMIELPGEVRMQLYQPTHPTAY